MTTPIRIAIAGQGRSGYKIHAHCLTALPEQFTITAAADLLAERREDARNEFSAEVYDDYTELLAAGGFEVFVNALPTPLHVPATLDALARGYHVVCEKPMAPTVAEFDRMAAAARRTGKLLLPFQNNRLQPFFDKIQEVIASGVLGKIIHVRSTWGGFRRRWDWQTLRRNMGGTLFNTGPHAIDQALVLFGEKCEPEVFCRMDCNNQLGGNADDLACLTLYDPARRAPVIEIHITQYLAYPEENLYTICGTCGTMKAGFERIVWRYYDPAEAPDQPFWENWSVDRDYPREELPWQEESWQIDEDLLDGSVGYTLRSLPSGPQRFYENVFDVLRNNAEPIITLPEVRRQIRVLQLSHEQNDFAYRPED